jgi:hypothetical protein
MEARVYIQGKDYDSERSYFARVSLSGKRIVYTLHNEVR